MKTSKRAVVSGTLGLLMCGFNQLTAATFTWDGGGSQSTWGQAANWGAISPVKPGSTTDDIIFDGALNTSPDNNLGSTPGGIYEINKLTFAVGASAFTLGGAASLRFGGTSPTITQSATPNQTVNEPVILNAATSIAGSGAGALTFGAQISGGSALALNQTGGAVIFGAANTYTGGTTLGSGAKLALGITDALPSTGTFTMSGGTLTSVGNVTDTSVGALSLTTSTTSIIDLANGNVVLNFANAGASFGSGILKVYHWTTGLFGNTPSVDKIGITGTYNAAFRFPNIEFYSDGGSTRVGTSGSVINGELVPAPEPVNIALVGFGVGAAGVAAVRRMKRRNAAQGVALA